LGEELEPLVLWSVVFTVPADAVDFGLFSWTPAGFGPAAFVADEFEVVVVALLRGFLLDDAKGNRFLGYSEESHFNT